MRIGVVLDNYFPPDPRVENEALTLIEHGHDVHLFCVDYEHNGKEFEILNGINVHRIRLPKYLYFFSALAYTIPYYHSVLRARLTRFLKETNIHVWHVHDIQAARSVFDLNEKFHLPVILDLHENRPEIMKFYSHVNSALGKLLISPSKWKQYEYRYIKEATKVIVVTDEAKQYYIRHTGEHANKFHVVPNTVRPEFYTTYEIDNCVINQYENYYTILYLGDTGTRRGLETVIHSLKYIIPIIPNVKLVFVGKNKTDKILKALVDANNWKPYVDFLGWKDFKLFPTFITACDIGICPIHKNIHHDTTYANKLFQYMAFGKPVIVSNCIAQQKLVEQYDCGLVFKDRNAKDFAERVITLYQNQEYYNRLALNSKNAIREHLNWSVLSLELINLYKEL